MLCFRTCPQDAMKPTHAGAVVSVALAGVIDFGIIPLNKCILITNEHITGVRVAFAGEYCKEEKSLCTQRHKLAACVPAGALIV